MDTQLLNKIVEMIECEVNSRPRDVEFEMAYQARIAIDRIKFAIKHTEQYGPHTDPMLNVGIQLLDALERLENADRRFQERTRTISGSRSANTVNAAAANGGQQKTALEQKSRACTAADSVQEKLER